MIKVEEMLKIMKEQISRKRLRPFSVGYLTADKSRGTGGEYRTIDQATLSQKGNRSGSVENRTIAVELRSGDVTSLHLDTILFFNDIPTA